MSPLGRFCRLYEKWSPQLNGLIQANLFSFTYFLIILVAEELVFGRENKVYVFPKGLIEDVSVFEKKLSTLFYLLLFTFSHICQGNDANNFRWPSTRSSGQDNDISFGSVLKFTSRKQEGENGHFH